MSGYSLCECGCGRPAPIARRTDTRWGVIKGEPRRFIKGHSGHRWQPGEWAKGPSGELPTNWRDRIAVTDNGCWLWQGRTNDQGYGLYGDHRVHRLSYEAHVGPIPEGLTLDHVCHSSDAACVGGSTCRHRACMNPAHLEPVTPAENTRRGRSAMANIRRKEDATHCSNGHEWTPENTIQRPRQRKCRECCRLASQRNNAKRRGMAA